MKTKFNGILTLLLAFVVQLSFAQERTISGTVSDADGPLPEVSIIIKGTTTGVVSDFDGNFSISAKTGDVLQFNSVGYADVEKTVGASNTISVVMDADGAIEDVVVTTFGRKVEKRTSTYAVQNVEGSDLTAAREANVVNSLSGKIAGVQITNSSGAVGASTRVVLRGSSSITGSSSPLYIVDGIPINNSSTGNAGSSGGVDAPNGTADINPDDIETISVLKGPAAAALYGVRASNGVIVITTKKGKRNSGLGISLNTTVSFENPLLLPDYQNSFGQGGNQNYFQWINGTSGDGGVDESWGPPLDAGLEFVQWNSYTVGGAPLPWVSKPDNIKNFYETGVSLSNNLSLSGGGDDTNFRLSFGNSNQTGMIPFTDYRRFTVNGNGSKTFGDKLTASLGINYSKGKSDNLSPVGYSNENPVQQFIWSGRNVDFDALRDWRNLPLSPAGTAAEGTPLNWNTVFQNNPYWALEQNTNDFNKDRILGNFSLAYRFNDNWLVSGKVGTDHSNQLQTKRAHKGSNNFADGYYSETARTYTETNAEVLLNYNTNLTEDFTFDFTFGGNQMDRVSSVNFASNSSLLLPGFFNISNLGAGATQTLISREFKQAINSLFGFAKFGYKDYLFLEVTGRNDWSSILPVDNNNFFYPSVTGSAVVTDMIGSESNTLNFLKLRGGWAKVGGVGQLGAYSLDPTYGLSTTPWGAVTVGFAPGQLNNPAIKPESTTGYEIGVDSRWVNNKIRLNVTYYDQTTTDAIIPVQLSVSTGNSSAVRNVGELNNKGYEIQLGTSILKNDNWKVDVDVNFAQNKNEVRSLGGLESLVLGGQWNMNLEARVGEPHGVIVGTYFQRDPNGNVVYNNGRPVQGQGTKVLGDINPDWTGGANFKVSYKNISFNALVDAKIGGDVYSMTTAWGRYAGVLEETLVGRETGIVGNGVMNIGTATNPNYVPNNVVVTAETFNKATYSNNVVESAVFDASFVKLRQLQLGYKIPSNLLKNTFINDINFSVVARNVAILYKKAPHIDPETAFSDNVGEQGQEFGQLPSARSVGFNINVKF